MLKVLWISVLILSLVSVAHGDDFVCEDLVTITKWRRYLPSIDPTTLVQQPNELCTVISEANTPDQRAKNVGDPGAVPPVPPTIPQKYRKVVGGLTVEMDATEKQAVDAALLAAQEEHQTYVNEARGATCTYDTLDDVNAQSQAFRDNMNAVINGIVGTPASVQAALHILMDRLVLTMGVKLARCDLAHVKARQ